MENSNIVIRVPVIGLEEGIIKTVTPFFPKLSHYIYSYDPSYKVAEKIVQALDLFIGSPKMTETFYFSVWRA